MPAKRGGKKKKAAAPKTKAAVGKRKKSTAGKRKKRQPSARAAIKKKFCCGRPESGSFGCGGSCAAASAQQFAGRSIPNLKDFLQSSRVGVKDHSVAHKRTRSVGASSRIARSPRSRFGFNSYSDV